MNCMVIYCKTPNYFWHIQYVPFKYFNQAATFSAMYSSRVFMQRVLCVLRYLEYYVFWKSALSRVMSVKYLKHRVYMKILRPWVYGLYMNINPSLSVFSSVLTIYPLLRKGSRCNINTHGHLHRAELNNGNKHGVWGLWSLTVEVEHDVKNENMRLIAQTKGFIILRIMQWCMRRPNAIIVLLSIFKIFKRF